MSWGTDLWDQFENLASYTLKGIEFCDRYSRFVKERCEIENEYAARLKRLVKNYQPKKKGEQENEFTYARGFLMMVNEIHDVAGQHEQIAENLLTSIVKELQVLIHECKKERKECLQEGSRLNSTLQSQLGQLDRVKKKYEKSFGDSDKSHEAYQKADLDIHLSRAEVEKTKNIMHQKQQHCETCKKEYASELQKSNGMQTDHYTTLLPKVFQDLQSLEERRIDRCKGFISHSADTERSVIPIVNTCIDGMVRAANTVNSKQDIELVIEKYKSGFSPPGDIPFEDLSNGNLETNNSNSQTLHTPKAQRAETFKGTQSNKTKKRGGIFGIFSSSKNSPGSKGDETRDDYSHLPPNQQKKRLQQKIESIRQAITKETAERDGMQKMRDVYVQNPALGDAATLDGQLEENAQKIDKLNKELQKYEGYLKAAETRSTTLDAHDNSVNRNMSNLSLHSGGSTGSNPSTPNMPRNTHKKISLTTSTSSEGNASVASGVSATIATATAATNIAVAPSSEGSSPVASGDSATAATPTVTVATLMYQNVPNNLHKTSHIIHADDQTSSPPRGSTEVPYSEHDSHESFDDEMDDEFIVIGTCKAMYTFDAGNEGSIPMTEGEDLQVVEADQGDGWTRVRNPKGDEGFVPTSYVQITMY